MEKYVYDHVEVEIPVGGNAFFNAANLTRGICKGVKFVPYQTATPAIRTHAININVDDNSGDKILGKTDYRDFSGGNGGYLENFKPCNFKTHAQINVDVVSVIPIATEAFKGQLIFAIVEDCN
ncbi:hypothetical protein [Gelidibacter japonicus]|uniref:hypothetical protein n=1 Tax=Gelidibacter japonicus TaxID=1962232 RepID=UPI002AFDF43D|nr:hypothetical protein [Gelidibacter japonicus]